MTAPSWLNAVIADFGRAAGVAKLALNANGAAALKFANGVSLRFEYTGDELAIAATFALARGAAAVRRLLALANPRRAGGLKLRAGVVAKTGLAVVAVRIPERDVTLPLVNMAFQALWRAAQETGGAA